MYYSDWGCVTLGCGEVCHGEGAGARLFTPNYYMTEGLFNVLNLYSKK